MQFSGVLEFRDPGDPVGWANYVTARVLMHRDLCSQWEVWNEPPNYTQNTSAEVYGRMVALAYDAAKRQDPTVQIGLAAQSVNLNYLDRALQSGAKDKFDFITLHPYETGDLVQKGFEAQYMSIVPTVRKMLAARNPERIDVPVYFTEIGQPLKGAVDEATQASQLLKYYVMGIAQGVGRIHWFEPLDGDSGAFGLISPQGERRAAYQALRILIDQLGQQPRYLGWLRPDDRHHGFLFEGPKDLVLIAWSPPGQYGELALPEGSQVVDLRSGNSLPARRLAVTGVASIALLPKNAQPWKRTALANRNQPYPWDGKPPGADRIELSAPGGKLRERGLYLATTVATSSGLEEGGIDATGTPLLSFTVDPNFLSYTSTPIRISAVVRQNSDVPAGFNLKYESTRGTKSVGWNPVTSSKEWKTLSWRIDDSQFVGKFGFHFSLDADSMQNSGYSIKSVSVSKEP